MGNDYIIALENLSALYNSVKKQGLKTRQLNTLFTQILFCIFTEQDKIFYDNNFYNYLVKTNPDGSDFTDQLQRAFDVTKNALFNTRIPSIIFDKEMRTALIEFVQLDWSAISNVDIKTIEREQLNWKALRNSFNIIVEVSDTLSKTNPMHNLSASIILSRVSLFVRNLCMGRVS